MKHENEQILRVTVNPGPPVRSFVLEGWTVYEYDSVTSTNLVAAGLPAWSAVRADSQTAGRGRFQRSWISDTGGLWLSAVVPLSRDSLLARTLPLAIGVAVCAALEELGLKALRMRWPNDVLVKDRKLAGLLVDQFLPDTAVAGIGLNVLNDPERHDPSLKNTVARLSQFVDTVPPLETLTRLVLRHVKTTVADAETKGMAPLIARVNGLWGKPRLVELDLQPGLRRGTFIGVDNEGRLALAEPSGAVSNFNPSQVHHLAEL